MINYCKFTGRFWGQIKTVLCQQQSSGDLGLMSWPASQVPWCWCNWACRDQFSNDALHGNNILLFQSKLSKSETIQASIHQMVCLPEKKIFWLARDIIPAALALVSDTSVSSDVPETTWYPNSFCKATPWHVTHALAKRYWVPVYCLCSWPPHNQRIKGSHRLSFLWGRGLLLFLILTYPEPVVKKLVPWKGPLEII